LLLSLPDLLDRRRELVTAGALGGDADRGVVLGGQVLDAIGVRRGPGGRGAVVVAESAPPHHCVHRRHRVAPCHRCPRVPLGRVTPEHRIDKCLPPLAPPDAGAEDRAWIRRGGEAAVDDAGSVVWAWRVAARRTQVDVAAVLGTTQQHLSQIEKGQRPVSLELRREMVTELGIAPEDLGLSAGQSQKLVSRDGASPEIAASQLRWRNERRWLNQHRCELAKLVVQLYPAEHRVPGAALLAHPEWLVAEPLELGSLTVRLDEGPQTAEVDGSEPESEATRPLCTAGLRFERYTSAIKHLSPPALFESRPSYRLLDVSLGQRRLEFGLANYFDKIDICEALAHEVAGACMAEGLPSLPERLRGGLPFRALIGDPFDPQRRAIIPAIATLTIRLRRYPAEPSFLLHWRDPAKVAIAGGTYGVIPTGEFQPSSVALWDRHNDFDLWRNMVREYSEELLARRSTTAPAASRSTTSSGRCSSSSRKLGRMARSVPSSWGSA
jgi:transcriptional regulator with XRE-family HTH domain